MKSTATRIERMLEKIEALVPPPWVPWLSVTVRELREGQSREEGFAELKARHPEDVVGKTVDDFDWSDDVARVQKKALAEHIAAHPEDAGRTVEDFRWWINKIAYSRWRLENGRAIFDEDEPPPKIDVESEEDGRNDPAGAPTGNDRPELRTPAPDSNGEGLDGHPDHHRSGVVLSFAAGLKERSRRLGRPWQPVRRRR